MNKELMMLFLIGHMLGDYYLQSNRMAIKKESSFLYLLLHGILYTAAMALVILPVYSFDLLVFSLTVSGVHFLIDLIKFIIVVDHKYESKMFVIDQLLFLLTIFIMLFFIEYVNLDIRYVDFIYRLDHQHITLILKVSLLILLIMKPTSVMIRQVLYNYAPVNLENNDYGHKNAGSLIGILERLLIALLLTLNQFVVIGFVLTAKSITRYDKITKDPQFSEYYLLGTLLSILMVVVSYFVIMYL